jgi:hypothetical protein
MTKNMIRACFALLLAAGLVGCKAPTEGDAFEKAFERAKKTSDIEDVEVIAVDRGGELQTNVLKIGKPSPPKGGEVAESVPLTLSPRAVARVIRKKVSRLRYCLLDVSVRGKSGKAVLTLTIEPSGRVSKAVVAAPSFQGSNLATCVRKSALLWRFPKFKKGKITHSYPVIFKGR